MGLFWREKKYKYRIQTKFFIGEKSEMTILQEGKALLTHISIFNTFITQLFIKSYRLNVLIMVNSLTTLSQQFSLVPSLMLD